MPKLKLLIINPDSIKKEFSLRQFVESEPKNFVTLLREPKFDKKNSKNISNL